jgi:hypothetical protein
MQKAIFFLLFAFCIASALGIDAPFAPFPPDNGTNVPVTGVLSWVVPGTNLIVDGVFEGSRRSGWKPIGGFIAAGPSRAYSGTQSAVLSYGTTKIMYQDVQLPSAPSEISLSWADRLEHSAANPAAMDWGLTVEIWETNNAFLSRIYQSPTLLAATNDWTLRSTSLNEFVNRKIRLAFIYFSPVDGGGAYLDDVAVNVSTTPQQFEVQLSPDNLFAVATTSIVSRPFLNFTNLNLDQKYYWKASAITGDQRAESSVWSFKTALNTASTMLAIQDLDPLLAGYPIRFNVQRSLASGLTTNLVTPIRFALLSHTRVPSLVLSTLNLWNGIVEVRNVGAASVPLQNWRIVLYDVTTWPEPRDTFVIPSGTVGPLSGFTLRERFTRPGLYPTFNLGLDLSWSASGSNAVAAVLLQDPDGKCIDFVCTGSIDPRDIHTPIPVPIDQWRGPPADLPTLPQTNIVRFTGVDTDTGADWRSSRTSASLPYPYANGYELTPNSVNFVGSDQDAETIAILLTNTSSNLLLVAEDAELAIGTLPLRRIFPAWQVSLSLPATIHESSTSPEILCHASIPFPLSTNLTVHLHSDNPLLQFAPIQFSAGETNVSFTLSLIDDSVWNWERVSTITGDAGFLTVAPATVKLLDDEPVDIRISAPDVVAETSKTIQVEIQIAPAFAADVTLIVHSSSTNLLAPQTIQITAGQTNVSFTANIVPDGMITGNKEAVISIGVNDSIVNRTIAIRDNEYTDRELSLIIPPSVVVSTNSQTFDCQVQLSALSSGFVVKLTDDAGGLLHMPTEITIPPGETNVTFQLTVPGAPYQPARAFLVTAQIDDFAPSIAPIEIRREDGWSFDLGAVSQVFDGSRQRLVFACATNNTVSWMNPETGELDYTLQIGASPGAMALSDDGSKLFCAIAGEQTIRRIDMATRNPDMTISNVNSSVRSILVFAGATNAIAVASGPFDKLDISFYIDEVKARSFPNSYFLAACLGSIVAEPAGLFVFRGGQITNSESSRDTPRFNLVQDVTGAFYSDLQLAPQSSRHPLRILPDILLGGSFNFDLLNPAVNYTVAWNQNKVALLGLGKTFVLRTDRLRSGPPADLVMSIDAAPVVELGKPWNVAITVSNAGPSSVTAAKVSGNFQYFETTGRKYHHNISKGVLRYNPYGYDTIFDWHIGQMQPGEVQSCFLTLTNVWNSIGPSGMANWNAFVTVDSSQPDLDPRGAFQDVPVDIVPPHDLAEYILPFPTGLIYRYIDVPGSGLLWIGGSGGWLDVKSVRQLPLPSFPFSYAVGLSSDEKAIWSGLNRYSLPDMTLTHSFGPATNLIVLPGQPERVISVAYGSPNATVPATLTTTNGINPNGVWVGYVLKPIDHDTFLAYSPERHVLDIVAVFDEGLTISNSYTNVIATDRFACFNGRIYSPDGAVRTIPDFSLEEPFAINAAVAVTVVPALDRVVFAVPGALKIFTLRGRQFVGEIPFEGAADLRDIIYVEDDRCAVISGYNLYFIRNPLLAPLRLKSQHIASAQLKLDFNAVVGATYQLQMAESLEGPWIPIKTFTTTSTDESQFVEVGTSPQFFRLLVP